MAAAVVALSAVPEKTPSPQCSAPREAWDEFTCERVDQLQGPILGLFGVWRSLLVLVVNHQPSWAGTSSTGLAQSGLGSLKMCLGWGTNLARVPGTQRAARSSRWLQQRAARSSRWLQQRFPGEQEQHGELRALLLLLLALVLPTLNSPWPTAPSGSPLAPLLPKFLPQVPEGECPSPRHPQSLTALPAFSISLKG